MSTNPHPNLESFLEESLPDLVRRETSRQWRQQWIGQQVDSYRIEEQIGTGTHGVVFRARRSEPFERTVAIKLLPNLKGQATAKQFQNECQALADLQHANISEILTAGLAVDGTPYLIMPFLSGVPIDQYVQQHRFEETQIADLIGQLAEAVDFAHKNGFVHCDLKPDNILVDDNGRVTVMDFGLAVRIDDMDDLAQRPSWAPGTIGYAAPEVLLSRRNASPAVDIYSLGAVLYKMLTGEPPHQATGWLDSLVATTAVEAEPVRSRNNKVAPELARICEQCLAREPEARPVSAGDVKHRLAVFIEQQKSFLRKPPISLSAFSVLSAVAVLVILLFISLFLWPQPFGSMAEGGKTPARSPDRLSDQQVDWILEGIEKQLLRPGLKDPAEPGDFEATFAVMQDAAAELDSLLAYAPDHKQVRHRTATGYFLLGRAAHWVKHADYAAECLKRSAQMFRQLHDDYPDDGFLFDFFHTLVIQATLSTPAQRRDLNLLALDLIEGLHKSAPDNLHYSDALACTLVMLAEVHSVEHNAELFDLETAVAYATRARQLALWTCSQPDCLPLHRKHIMSSMSVLSEIARLKGNEEESVRLAAAARLEAIRLDDALQVADTKFHRFDKAWEYAFVLRHFGRSAEAMGFALEAEEMLVQLEELNWPDADNCALRSEDLLQSLQPLRELNGK